MKDYKDPAEVELSWKVIQFKVVSDVKKEIATWGNKADNYTDQLQMVRANTVIEQFAQLKFEAEVLNDFHMAFQLVEMEGAPVAPDALVAGQDETMQD